MRATNVRAHYVAKRLSCLRQFVRRMCPEFLGVLESDRCWRGSVPLRTASFRLAL